MASRALSTVVVATMALATLGCSIGADPDEGTGPDDGASRNVVGVIANREIPVTEDGTVSVTLPALEVTTATSRDRDCLVTTSGDIGLMEFYLDAAVEITSIDLRLIDPVGVRIIDEPLLVPAVNQGGSIPFAGTVEWENRASLLTESRFVEWFGREEARFATLVSDGSWLVLLRLAFDAREVSFGGLAVDYQIATPSGEATPGSQFTARARSDVRWTISPQRRGCD